MPQTNGNNKPIWYNVNLPEPYNRIALYNEDVYIHIGGIGLTKPDIVAWLVETESGTALSRDGDIFLSGNATVSMLEASINMLPITARPKRKVEIEKFKGVLSKIYTQLVNQNEAERLTPSKESIINAENNPNPA